MIVLIVNLSSLLTQSESDTPLSIFDDDVIVLDELAGDVEIRPTLDRDNKPRRDSQRCQSVEQESMVWI